jgi:hypothetical protein
MYEPLTKIVRAKGLDSLLLSLTVFGIILGPILTVWLPFRRSLEIRALLVLVVVSVPLAWGLRRPGWFRRIVGVPAPVIVGVGLWFGAAIVGALVGLARGNEFYLVAGQFLSMVLLPYAFAAARSLDLPDRAAVFASTFVQAALWAFAIHIGYWVARMLMGRPLLRLYLPNGLSLVGALIMALVIAIALATGPERRLRRLGAVGAAAFGIHIFGSGTRSVIVAAALGVVVYLMVWATARKGVKGLAAVVLSVVAFGTLVIAIFAAAWNAPRTSALPTESFLEPFWLAPAGGEIVVGDAASGMPMELLWQSSGEPRQEWISLPYLASLRGMYRWSVDVMGEGEGTGAVELVILNPSMEECDRLRFPVEAGSGWHHHETVLPIGIGNYGLFRFRVASEEGSNAMWRVRNIRLGQFWDFPGRSFHRQLLFFSERMMSSWERLRTGRLLQDPSMGVRLRETTAAISQVQRAPISTKLFGHGLGARLIYEKYGYNTLGEYTLMKNPNYIHNFFAFLAFKLGIFGGLAVLTALTAWVVRSIQMVASHRALGSVAPGAAALSVWIAYTAWSVFCPQYIDFGDAPLFGLFLACWMASVDSPGPDPDNG